MLMTELIYKKKNGGALTATEIEWMIAGFMGGAIPDYQMAAMLMAICLAGFTCAETAALTHCMAHSGDRVDLSAIPGVKIDKHSTGGVGDKTTLIACPIAAACGVPVAKMSGRGLGHTGGTVDKLEAIPGFMTEVTGERFIGIAREVGLALVGQSGNLAPADKKLYALRDVTATVDSPALIAASIMSKKIAAGCDGVVLDIKVGSGAFMRTLPQARALAQAMVDIGAQVGLHTAALLTDMEQPLGRAVGNALEVREAVDTLRGGGPPDLVELSLALAAEMLCLAGRGRAEDCMKLAADALHSGAALKVFERMVHAQGGDTRVLHDPAWPYKLAGAQRDVLSPRGGYVTALDARMCGLTSSGLGAGRATLDSRIDPFAGMWLHKKTGDAVCDGEVLATLYAANEALFDTAERQLLAAYEFGDTPPAKRPILLERVGAGA